MTRQVLQSAFLVAAMVVGASTLSFAQTTIFSFNIESLGLGSHLELRGPFPIEVDGNRTTREWLIMMNYGLRWVVVAERPNQPPCIGTPYDYRVEIIDGRPEIGYIEWPTYAEAMGISIYTHRFGPIATLKRFQMPACPASGPH